MSHDPTAPNDGDPAELISRFEQAISSLGPAELRALLPRLSAVGSDDERLTRTPPPSRRRPRRPDVVTYRVRIDLTRTRPPLWRRLELASDLGLDDVHDVIQAAFGWTDSHLHRFASGREHHDRDTEYYLSPFEVDEDEAGIPEGEVRLDEVLVKQGEKLFYVYDFGDDWEHTIALEAVLPREEGTPRAVCTAGRRPGPAEDCGGVPGYELISAATDPTDPDPVGAIAELARVFGDDIDPAAYCPTAFDVDEVNGVLAELGNQASDLPAALAELVDAVRSEAGRRALRRLIGLAELGEPVLVDAEIADRMVAPYTWLLDRVGDVGIKLTGAGYLPPSHVEAAVTELGLAPEWIGKGNREIQTMPVMSLRESAQKMGLLRKHRGSLDLTVRGRRVHADPVALWWQLAGRLPMASTDRCETQAGLILLVLVAAGATDDLDSTIAGFLGEIGWMGSDGTPLTGSMASYAAWDTKAVLRRLGGLADPTRASSSERVTADGAVFARAALRTWPGSGR
ncbi:MAG: plasmid pRiA4b ORF-3 family protein [Mycobacteriales bacterium]